MRASPLFAAAATAAGFFAQAQVPRDRKAVASFYHASGTCDDIDQGAEVTLYQGGNATAQADAGPFYSIRWGAFDPACAVDFDVDWKNIKWYDDGNNQKRDASEVVGRLEDVGVDMKDVHVISWGQKKETVVDNGPVHPHARRQTTVVYMHCQSVGWRDEGLLAIKGVTVSGC
ncbi:carbon-nitrogen hydrolase [Apiospora arundinis]